jgi:hypothetical protein
VCVPRQSDNTQSMYSNNHHHFGLSAN